MPVAVYATSKQAHQHKNSRLYQFCVTTGLINFLSLDCRMLHGLVGTRISAGARVGNGLSTCHEISLEMLQV